MSAEPQAKKPSSHSESYRGLFMLVFHDLMKELTEEGLKNPEISDGIQHLQEVRCADYEWALYVVLNLSCKTLPRFYT